MSKIEIDVTQYVNNLRSTILWSNKCVDAFVLTANVAKEIMSDVATFVKINEVPDSIDISSARALEDRIPKALQEYYVVTAYRAKSKRVGVCHLHVFCRRMTCLRMFR